MTESALQHAAALALGLLNAPTDPRRLELVAAHLAVVDGDVRVVDGDGNVRTRVDPLGTGQELPMTAVQLIQELVGLKTAEARELRWKPYGRPV